MDACIEKFFSFIPRFLVSLVVVSATTAMAAEPATVNYIYDQFGQLIVEMDAHGNTLKEYVYLDGQLLAIFTTPNTVLDKVVEKTKPGGLVQNLASLLPSAPLTPKPQPYYAHTDHLGTVQALTDQNRRIVWQADYEPFGKARITTETIMYNQRLPGQYYDAETGLHQNWHRDYDPSTGRYLESDPIGLAGGLSTYSYANGNPLKLIDPSGLDGTSAWWWATMKIGNEDYQWWDSAKESRGPINSRIGGRASPKCNSFVWDTLLSGGNPPGRMPDGRIPLASEWQSGIVAGYRQLHPSEKPMLGDVVTLDGHVGIYAPLSDGQPGTISASSRFQPIPRVVHNDWGFRKDQFPTILRCNCDDP